MAALLSGIFKDLFTKALIPKSLNKKEFVPNKVNLEILTQDKIQFNKKTSLLGDS